MFSFFLSDPNRDWHEQRKAALLIDTHGEQAIGYVDRQLADRTHSGRSRRYWQRIRRAVVKLQAEEPGASP